MVLINNNHFGVLNQSKSKPLDNNNISIKEDEIKLNIKKLKKNDMEIKLIMQMILGYINIKI